ncbi:MAG: hypothetical protein JXR42_04375 [Gammaproteobacteria bacterium]|nr:hypothetical protein [Gammaproteobacteria bacterium]
MTRAKDEKLYYIDQGVEILREIFGVDDIEDIASISVDTGNELFDSLKSVVAAELIEMGALEGRIFDFIARAGRGYKKNHLAKLYSEIKRLGKSGLREGSCPLWDLMERVANELKLSIEDSSSYGDISFELRVKVSGDSSHRTSISQTKKSKLASAGKVEEIGCRSEDSVEKPALRNEKKADRRKGQRKGRRKPGGCRNPVSRRRSASNVPSVDYNTTSDTVTPSKKIKDSVVSSFLLAIKAGNFKKVKGFLTKYDVARLVEQASYIEIHNALQKLKDPMHSKMGDLLQDLREKHFSFLIF